MSNSFNKPIILTGTMASDYWTTIGVPAGQGKPLLIKKITWVGPGASANFTITDASTAANVLRQGATPASYGGPDVEYDFIPPVPWRNWKCTALSAGTLIIDPE